MLEGSSTELALIALRTVAIYLGLLLILRLAGKRELGQLHLFDLVVILLIANAVQNAMVGPNTSVTGGLTAAVTLVGVNWVVSRLGVRSLWLRKELSGSPTMLIYDGQLIEDHLRREGITLDDLEMALREHGIDEIKNTRLAILEVDGTISVVPEEAPVYRSRRRVRGRKPGG